jgi:hypothetical protein
MSSTVPVPGRLRRPLELVFSSPPLQLLGVFVRAQPITCRHFYVLRSTNNQLQTRRCTIRSSLFSNASYPEAVGSFRMIGYASRSTWKRRRLQYCTIATKEKAFGPWLLSNIAEMSCYCLNEIVATELGYLY